MTQALRVSIHSTQAAIGNKSDTRNISQKITPLIDSMKSAIAVQKDCISLLHTGSHQLLAVSNSMQGLHDGLKVVQNDKT